MNREPLRNITDAEVRQYHDEGVVCLRGLFDRDWIDRMYGAIERSMQSPGARVREAVKPGEPGRFHMNVFMWRWDADFRAYALESPAGAIAARLLGASSVRMFYDQIFVKEPMTRALTHWHQDLPFWPLRGEAIASIWLTLTPVDAQTSGVEFIAGSHRWNKFYRAMTPDRDSFFSNQALEVCPDFDARRDDPSLRFVSFAMAPGDVTVHHPLIVHASGPNHSPAQRRLALSNRYFADRVIWDARPSTLVMPEQRQFVSGAAPDDFELFPVAWPR
jgi:ectoine hydroxylase-related dioxygenase (phytanoyl-CoA dioxygenase family)